MNKSLRLFVICCVTPVAMAETAPDAMTSTQQAPAPVQQIMVPMHLVSEKGVGPKIGLVTLSTSTHGVQFEPNLRDLPAGVHGFHLHQNGSCETATKDGKTTPAGAAGGHYDPENRSEHGAPWGDGHKGDLPSLYVNTNGTSTQPVIAPRLSFDDVYNRALVIHAGSDNYSDFPEPLGGGGARFTIRAASASPASLSPASGRS